MQLIVYVDVDDTLVRSAGTKVISMTATIDHVRALKSEGVVLYCWSSGGGEYAKGVAERLGIVELYEAFLPKPHVLIDDQSFADWRRLIQVHPMQCAGQSLESYRKALTTDH
jgi:hypothetical protein